MTELAAMPDDALVRRLRAAGCVFAEQEAALLTEATDTPESLEHLVSRRVTGEPLEHLLGRVEFAGEQVTVTPGVFVPRTRTSHLVDQAAAAIRRRMARFPTPSPVVVDLCCGCGAIGAVIASRMHRSNVPITLHAADVDAAAVACAAVNLAPFDAAVHTGDLYDALPSTLRGTVDVIVANVPYVPSWAVALMPPEARNHEPHVALDGGDDGLAVARRLVTLAPDWLADGGIVMFECDETQVGAAAEMVRRADLSPVVVTDADREATVIGGVHNGEEEADGSD